MNRFLLFICGLVVGVLGTILFLYLISSSITSKNGLIGLTIFPEKGECIETKTDIKIFQVLEPNIALAETGEYSNRIMLLLVNDDGKSFYDDQMVKVPKGKCAKQIGTYKYTTKVGFDKTVPAVVIE